MRLPLAAALALWAGAAPACEICLAAAGERITFADRLAFADRVVLATPAPDGGFRIVTAIAGSGPAGARTTEPVAAAEAAPGEPHLLVAGKTTPSWTSLGSIDPSEADWLRMLAGSSDDWHGRVVEALPHLGGGQHTLAEEIAWGEIAQAPYASLAAARGRLDPGVVAGWLDDPDFAPHRGGALHLYGLVGGPEGAGRIRAEADAAAASHDETLLGPLLTADLELEGPARVDWIETRNFADRSRSMAEIEAALLALKLQGEANATVPRARIVAAFRRFIAERPALAASVAVALADWGSWAARADFEALLAARTVVDPASEYAMNLYLQRAAAAQPNGG